MAAAARPALAAMTPRYSVVIPHRDDLRGLDRTLSALAIHETACSFEVIVVDNGTIETGVAAQQVADRGDLAVRVVSEPVLGAGPARNRGAACARGDYLAFLDCDCVPLPGWLDNLDRALRDADVVGGVVHVRIVGEARSANAAQWFDTLFGFQSESAFAATGLLLSGNLSMPRAIFGDVGGFRTGISEDREWCTRARHQGRRLALSRDAQVVHGALDDTEALHRRWARVTCETFALNREEGRSRLSWLAYSIAVGGSPLVHGFRVLRAGRIAQISLMRRWQILCLLFAVRVRRARIGIGLLWRPDGAGPGLR